MTDRATATTVGALFLVGTIAGLVGLTLQESVVGGADYLTAASRRSDRLATAAVLQLVMAAAVVSISVAIFPVLRRATERLAVGYVVARAVEGMVFVVGATGLLTLGTLSEHYLASDSDSTYAALGQLVTAQGDWMGHGILDAAVFGLGALVLNAALYQGRLVPPWLSVWGLAGAAAYLAAGVMVIYGLEPLSMPQVVLEAPLGLQEIALAVWLILKGFRGALEGAAVGDAGTGRSLVPKTGTLRQMDLETKGTEQR